MAEKVTTMVIKVDLECKKCLKKIRRVLSKIPEIQNQIYDTKAGTVTITVVSCCPDKIKNKISCRGGKAVKGIEIKVPKPPEKPKEPEKPKQPEKPKEPEKPKQPEKPKEPEKPKQPEKPKEPAAPPPKPTPPPVHQHPPPVPVYPSTCCSECYQGFGGGPCYHGYGMPAPHQETYGRPVYDSWGGGGGGYRYAYDDRNQSSCTIM